MAELVENCPRCGADQITFDVLADSMVDEEYGWQSHHEIFSVCRRCGRATIFFVKLADPNHQRLFRERNSILTKVQIVNDYFKERRPVTIRDTQGVPSPALIPANIAAIFNEGASSLAGGCHNAAGAMFRLCVDLATKGFLPEREEDIAAPPNRNEREKLAFRLQWLFRHHLIPADLEELAACIREDGNDGAHEGNLTQAEAEDLLDFTIVLLERIYTEPGRVAAARQRRLERHNPP
ncbi:DUF4145 domain-containing protein [Rhizorhabdus dicambivorans]|nr:DUF4145 domain-containing protein [Rhizorhabdus dicambivorans]